MWIKFPAVIILILLLFQGMLFCSNVNSKKNIFHPATNIVVFANFTSNGTFVVPSGITLIDVLIVAGGGGGGSGAVFSNNWQGGGGGGAGRLIYYDDYVVTPSQEINITIGEGGLFGADDGQGGNGGDTIFGVITADGGGGGGKRYTHHGEDGGSGGGGAHGAGGHLPGQETGGAGYGNDGGGGSLGNWGGGGGGGGGAGSVGSTGIQRENGGPSVPGAAGGTGMTFWGVTYAKGGAGGDGATTNYNGKGGDGGQPANGGDGGAGIVIIRYNYSNLPPNQPTHENPTNNSDYEDVYDVFLNCNTSDSNADNMNVTFYWGNGTAIATAVNISNNSQASIYLPDYINPDWLAHDTTFYWYVNVTDGFEITAGPTWNFNTCKAWDLNADRIVNYLDISSLVSHYRETVTPGAEPWDINEDGVNNYLDISSLVSHYRESY